VPVEPTLEELERTSAALEPVVESECSAFIVRLVERAGLDPSDDNHLHTAYEFVANECRGRFLDLDAKLNPQPKRRRKAKAV